MSKLKLKVQIFLNPTVIILFAVILRLIPHPPNVAPIAAMALFGGVYLNKRYALVVPLLAMLISDLVIGFHASMGMVYTSFFLTGMLGLWIRRHKSIKTIIFGSLVSSLLFFIFTNFNYWYATPLYAKTVKGLLDSYFYALPFFRNTIIGDLLYTGLFFGVYEFVHKLSRKLLYSP